MSDYDNREFDLSGALDRLAARVCSEIKSGKRRQRATDELRGHLEDAAEDIMNQGCSPEKTYAELERSLGDTDKLSTLMASVHNTHHFPVFVPFLAGVALIGGLISLYLATKNEYLKAWLGVGLQLFAISVLVVLALIAGNWIRAIGKRVSAIRRLKECVKKKGGTLTRHENFYKSLFGRIDTPEMTVDIGDRRYIIYLWATVKRRRTLHLQDNGIYSYDKHFGYMLVSPGIAPHSRVTFFRPKGMENDPLFTWYHSEMVKLPQGAHLMPEINYGEYFSADKVNVPIFLLNPIPLDVEICENGHIHRLAEGDTLPVSLGSARLYSMSGLISLMEEIRIFGKEGGQKRQ